MDKKCFINENDGIKQAANERGTVFTVAILGVGSRGGNAYGRDMHQRKDCFKIVALCDTSEKRLSIYGDEFGVAKENRFSSEEHFFKEKRADVLVIATPDKFHAQETIQALKLGYDVLLEKPAATTEEECGRLIEAQKESGKCVLLCHVLRYSAAYIKVKEILESGRIGNLVSLLAEEPVNYWHQAHSFVRGKGASSVYSAPMLLGKCSHDLDLICYYVGTPCTRVSSIGGLSFFKEENAPELSTDRCVECPHINRCPYSAKRIYIDGWKSAGMPENSWPTNFLAPTPITEEKLRAAIEQGPFGRCVFRCDNDAVDHQLVQMEFEGGVTACLTMNGFNSAAGRRYLLSGTYGTIELTDKTLTVREFGCEPEVLSVPELNGDGEHGGGDIALINELYSVLCAGSAGRTSIENSAEGYRVGMAAERSRLSGGELIKLL